MKKTLTFVFAFAILTTFSTTVGTANIVFQDNFNSSTSGALPSPGVLGTPTVGTTVATGGLIGSGGNRAYATGNNGTSNAITVDPNGSFNDVGTPAGNYLTANLSSPAAITGTLGAGQTTTVDFEIASFGTGNAVGFKYGHIIGLSSTGDEVFQFLWRAGSGSGTRELFAREFGEDNTTFANGGLASVDGTRILDNVSFGINNTTGTVPSRVGVSVTIDQNGWNASAAPTGGSSLQTPATGLGIASGATDLASIVFFSSHNTIVNNQNKGLWVDSVIVETDLIAVPEPTSSVILFGIAAVYGLRRRR